MVKSARFIKRHLWMLHVLLWGGLITITVLSFVFDSVPLTIIAGSYACLYLITWFVLAMRSLDKNVSATGDPAEGFARAQQGYRDATILL